NSSKATPCQHFMGGKLNMNASETTRSGQNAAARSACHVKLAEVVSSRGREFEKAPGVKLYLADRTPCADISVNKKILSKNVQIMSLSKPEHICLYALREGQGAFTCMSDDPCPAASVPIRDRTQRKRSYDREARDVG